MKAFFKKAIFQRIFFLIAAGFMVPMGVKMFRAYLNASESFSYQKAQCTILHNELLSKADGPVLNLQYQYEFGGQSFTGTRYQWGLEDFSNQNRGIVKAFYKNVPVGSLVDCYVDGNQPEISVIEKGSSYLWYENLAFTIFLTVSVFGLVVSLFFPNAAEKIFVPSDPS